MFSNEIEHFRITIREERRNLDRLERLLDYVERIECQIKNLRAQLDIYQTVRANHQKGE